MYQLRPELNVCYRCVKIIFTEDKIEGKIEIFVVIC